jgi:hypothetical protein
MQLHSSLTYTKTVEHLDNGKYRYPNLMCLFTVTSTDRTLKFAPKWIWRSNGIELKLVKPISLSRYDEPVSILVRFHSRFRLWMLIVSAISIIVTIPHQCQIIDNKIHDRGTPCLVTKHTTILQLLLLALRVLDLPILTMRPV